MKITWRIFVLTVSLHMVVASLQGRANDIGKVNEVQFLAMASLWLKNYLR